MVRQFCSSPRERIVPSSTTGEIDMTSNGQPPGQALVLGATGGIGGAVTEALLVRGWSVRALTRDPIKAAQGRDPRIRWVQGDAMEASAVRAAAHGAELIVHAVNPPGYHDWDKLVLPWIDNTVAAAKAVGARILLPGGVYNYGPDAGSVVAEDAPQHPATRKGAIRVQLEQRLRAAADDGVASLVVRAGDFFGGRARGNNWFSAGLVKPGAPLKSLTYPGAAGVGHSWAYLPDLARTMAELVERPQARAFEAYNFAGHWDADGTGMIAAIRKAAGRLDLPLKPFPWTVLALASPFVTTLREMQEMRYLWREPLRLDNARLVEALGREPHTPLDAAVARTLGDLGCLARTEDVAA
jgi:nucleoside-diphosphate-sugar epimerase